MMPDDLDRHVFTTVRYFDLFDQPVTPVQIWRTLIVGPENSPLRWGGHKVYGLKEVQAALANSAWLKEQLGTQWGYYFLRGRNDVVALHLERHALAQAKWKITQRAVRWLSAVPFVRMVAMSGSLAEGHTKPTSDLDLFIVVREGRLWLTRLLLLVASQILGRRRRYWDSEAPDKLCLNHYVTSDDLGVAAHLRNIYTAIQYHHLIPLKGYGWYKRFTHVQDPWVKQWLMFPVPPALTPVQYGSQPRLAGLVAHIAESVLGEPLFGWLERLAERWQKAAIIRHMRPGETGVFVSDHELAFHPASKVSGVLARFAAEAGQRTLW